MKKIMIFVMIFVLIIFLLIYFLHVLKKYNLVQLGVECEITDVNRSDRIKINVDEKELKNDNKFLKVKQIELIRKN